MKLLFRRSRSSRKELGAPPGTLIVPPESPAPRITVIAYGPDDYREEELQDVSQASAFLGTGPVVWVNVDGLGDEAVLRRLAEIFDLHRLILEDIATLNQRAKVEQYGDKLFFVTHMVSLNEELETEQLSLILAPSVVLTVQERPGDCLDPVRNRIRQKLGRIRQAGADYLAYSLLDAVIDHFFPVLEEFGERLELLEDEVAQRADSELVSQIHGAKRGLLALRRAAWPQRDAINWILRDEVPLIAPETRLYFRDCYDHVTRIIDAVETYRELASDLLGVYQSTISNNMNAVMKVLTIIATIFIPMTFIAGVYGMNFDPHRSKWNMPELKWVFGYPFALALMAVIGIGMLIFFRKKKWI